MITVKEICSFIDYAVPVVYQESYDNSGLQTGNPDNKISSALLSLDATIEVIEEASAGGYGLVITHHPVIFHPLKSVTGKSYAEKIILKAIKEDIAIYSAHTSLDMFNSWVSRKMAEKLGLKEISTLKPLENKLLKLVTFVPVSYAGKVREALFSAGAGHIGNYDMCSFNAEGYGTFRGNEHAKPFVGERGELHKEKEVRIETILPVHLKNNVLRALLEAHPYEEVAWDMYPLLNEYSGAGTGCTGIFREPPDEKTFLGMLSEVFNSKGIRYSRLTGRRIKKVALCGGSGAFLIETAISSGADALVTGDVKYHDFFKAGGNMLLADIGHYESEIYCLEILYDLIIKNFPNFALRFSEIKTNPINYY